MITLRSIKKPILGSLPAVVMIVSIALAQEEQGEYIVDNFKVQLSETPKMAWLVPPDIVITEEKHPSIYLYLNRREIEKAMFVKVCSDNEIAKIRKKHRMFCENTTAGKSRKYYLYQLLKKSEEPFGYPDRVFYMSKPLPGSTVVGYRYGQLDQKTLEDALKVFEVRGKRYLHNHFTVLPLGSKNFYSFHGLYDKESKQIFRKAILLHDSGGRVLSRKVWDISEDTLCDGCPWPTYENENPDTPAADMSLSFAVLNAFNMSRFAYPVIMLYDFTLEVNDIEFVTFDPKGIYNEYEIYEYIAECQSDK